MTPGDAGELISFVETFDEPVPGRQVVPVVHGRETHEVLFVDGDEP